MKGVPRGIKALAPDDRPREKMLMKGVDALSNAELFSIILRSGQGEQNAVALARTLLGSVGNSLSELGRQTVGDLTRIKGLGTVKALTVVAALEIGRRRQTTGVGVKVKVSKSSEVVKLFQPMLADYRTEAFAVAFLNQGNRVRHLEVVSRGGVTSTIADPKVIMRKALEQDAVKLILCHNHPSGNVTPSKEDLLLTTQLRNAARLLDIRVLDHLIVADTGYYSFREDGLV
jgi:DNA repair protein RadC